MECRRAYVLGNGPSITPALLESLDAPAFAVNRIWKIFEWTRWRPQFYVRAEVPTYIASHVKEDLHEMGKVGCVMFLQDGFRGLEPGNSHRLTRFEYFKTCPGLRHDWHLPEICGYGTVVHIAMQIAYLQGFDEIHVLGCDLGNRHFYNDELFQNAELAGRAHEIARRCCPAKLVYPEDPCTYGKEKEIYRSRAQ
jgi:hypothetical protein